MPKEGRSKNFSWDFYSKLIILVYCLFQIIRLPILPQSMDIFYHLLTAWGFIQAGGYSGWDFWQYAPLGRPHIYPPFFHLVLAILMKLGMDRVILAKFFEVTIPVVFFGVLWNFVKKNYDERLGFFVMLMLNSSFTFYHSIINHIPATLALILGFLALEKLYQKNYLPSLLLLALCFYTHIGISWFFALSVLFYGLFNREYQKTSLIVFILSLVLSTPVLFKQLMGARFISALGLHLKEKYICQFKILDYLLAFLGIFFACKKGTKYRLFLSFFFASLIFIIYPYRFFSAEGYIAILFLCALALYNLYEKFKSRVNLRCLSILTVVFILFLSPTLSLNKIDSKDITYKLNIFDSAFLGMLFTKGKILWYPQEYLSTATLLKNNSQDTDIIYSTLNIAGVTLASLSGRSTANALLPEIGPLRPFDPFAVSKIIIFTRSDNFNTLSQTVSKYNLSKIGENKLFIIYHHPLCQVKAVTQKASVPFLEILLISFIFIFLFWQARKQKLFPA